MFKIERALTDDEIDFLTYVSNKFIQLHEDDVNEAIITLDVLAYSQRKAYYILSDISAKDVNHEFTFSKDWADLVRTSLNTKNFEFGYGFVGWVEPDRPIDVPTLAVEGK